MNKILSITYIYVIYLIKFTRTVPPQYCLQRLNSSDCHGAPTPVFSYYKPGSRCEIEIWRGCPTKNKFDDEYQCSHYCIARFLYRFNDKQTKNSCHKIFKRSRCTKQTVPVYTYNSKRKKCERALWKGCKTDNKFLKKSTCLATCKPNDDDNTSVNLLKFSSSEAKKINSILDAFVDEDILNDLSTTSHQTTKKSVQTVTLSNLLTSINSTIEGETSVLSNGTPKDLNVEITTMLTTSTTTDQTTTSTILTTTNTEAPILPSTATTSPTTAAPPTTTAATILTSTTTTTAAPPTTTAATILSSTTTTTAATQTTTNSETTTETTKVETFKTTTNIPPSGTVEEVVVPGADYTED